jgi:hypothetical protein
MNHYGAVTTQVQLRILPQRGCVPKPRVGRCVGLPWVTKATNPVYPNGVAST